MPVKLAALRSRVELALAGRVAAPFTYRDRKIIETVSAGIPEIDSLAGGLPRGGLTEICGPSCSGCTSLLLSALAERTSHAEVCALVDGRDAFDPQSAEAAGVELKQLLWVRCRNIDQALRATDLILQGGGFGLVAVDLSDIPPETVRYVPLNAWFRFRRAVEDTPTILMLLEQEANAKTCASLVLRLEAEPARWTFTREATATRKTAADTWETVVLENQALENRSCEIRDVNLFSHSSACLLDGSGVRAEVLRSRTQAATGTAVRGQFVAADAVDATGIFETKATWGYLGGLPVEKYKPK
jgi:recombination protein RecA